jgi:hypothetical protein
MGGETGNDEASAAPREEHGPQPDDHWAAARAAQRDDVRAALARRERRCPA